MHNTPVKACAHVATLVALALACVSQAAPANAPSWSAERTYCAAVRNTPPPASIKYPDHPLWTSEWRCASGRLLVCPAGADGVACSRRIFSKKPTPAMIEECASGAEGLGVLTGAYGYIWR
jgi:hypothetical protein